MNGSATGPKGLRDSLPYMVTCSWIRSGDRLTTYLEHRNYGATGSPFFSLYSKYLAQATTLTGQCLIRTVSEHISKFIDISIGAKNPDPNKYTIAGDTDSVVGDTKLDLQIDGAFRYKTIEDLYNEAGENYCKKDDKNKSYVKKVIGIDALTIDENENLIYSPVRYVMKHTVKKRMFRLKINGNCIDITEDHSLICKRNDKIIKIKPSELKEDDSILYISYK